MTARARAGDHAHTPQPVTALARRVIFGRVTVRSVVRVVAAPEGVKARVMVTFTGPVSRRR